MNMLPLAQAGQRVKSQVDVNVNLRQRRHKKSPVPALAGTGLVFCARQRQAVTTVWRRRRMVAPVRPKPAMSMAQLAGSGTPFSSKLLLKT